MKKWFGPLLSILFIALCLSVPFASDIFKTITNQKGNIGEYKIVLTQDTEKEEKGDTYSITLLKQIREKVDAWLKSLNERIEREDITRFEVRFYEILRNILEWVREKIDARIESSEEKRQKKKEKEGFLRETRQRAFSFFEIG
jgi:vacuolar-type H+-ATPase subunit I/STV1